MVEVGDDDSNGKVPGEDEEPDMGNAADYGDEEEEELVPVKAKHGGLFGADLSSVKF